jgi:hypothetical protein
MTTPPTNAFNHTAPQAHTQTNLSTDRNRKRNSNGGYSVSPKQFCQLAHGPGRPQSEEENCREKLESIAHEASAISLASLNCLALLKGKENGKLNREEKTNLLLAAQPLWDQGAALVDTFKEMRNITLLNSLTDDKGKPIIQLDDSLDSSKTTVQYEPSSAQPPYSNESLAITTLCAEKRENEVEAGGAPKKRSGDSQNDLPSKKYKQDPNSEQNWEKTIQQASKTLKACMDNIIMLDICTKDEPDSKDINSELRKAQDVIEEIANVPKNALSLMNAIIGDISERHKIEVRAPSPFPTLQSNDLESAVTRSAKVFLDMVISYVNKSRILVEVTITENKSVLLEETIPAYLQPTPETQKDLNDMRAKNYILKLKTIIEEVTRLQIQIDEAGDAFMATLINLTA